MKTWLLQSHISPSSFSKIPKRRPWCKSIYLKSTPHFKWPFSCNHSSFQLHPSHFIASWWESQDRTSVRAWLRTSETLKSLRNLLASDHHNWSVTLRVSYKWVMQTIVQHLNSLRQVWLNITVFLKLLSYDMGLYAWKYGNNCIKIQVLKVWQTLEL